MDKIEKVFTCYKIIFPDEKVYIGITCQNLKSRFGRNGSAYKNQPVYEAIQKFGWENIKKEIVKENLNMEDAKKKEQELIKLYQNKKGVYNKSKGGECGTLLSSKFEIDGIIYDSYEVAEMATAEGINYHDITTRINHHGWSLEKALTQEKMEKNQKIKYNNEYHTFDELIQFSKVSDLTICDLYIRINHHNWDVERALTQPKNVKLQPKGVGEKEYFYNGKWCNSYDLFLLRKDERITQRDIVKRIKRSKWDIEKAISVPPKNMNKKYEYKGKLYTSKELEEICPNGLQYNTIIGRIKSGWSVEDAVEIPSGGKPNK